MPSDYLSPSEAAEKSGIVTALRRATYSNMDVDRGLLLRARDGDMAAQAAIVEQFAPMVFRLTSRFFRVREDVEDIAQDVFVKLLGKFDQIRPDDNFPGWLARVTVNTCYDELRRTKRRREAMEIYGPELAKEGSAAPPQAGSFDRIRLGLETLDAKLKIPLVLKEVEGMSIEEIARTMGLTQTNVKVRLFRARKKLAKFVGEEK